LKVYSEFLAKIRAYAKEHARRHYIILDGHVPTGGMVKDGVSLLDFNSFPLRIKPMPGRPYEAKLQVGYLDAIFKRSKGCISPSGWKCESLPFLVEFDNFGKAKITNVADTTNIFIWGWMKYHGSLFKKNKTEITGWFMPGTGSGKQIQMDILRCQDKNDNMS